MDERTETNRIDRRTTTTMKKKPMHTKVRVARTFVGASLLALTALSSYGQGGSTGTGAQAGGGSAGTTTGTGTPGTGSGNGTPVGTGTTGLGTGSLGGQGNKGTPGTGTHAAPFGTGTRQPIPAGSSPPSNTTVTNPTGTYDSGGNPALTSPADKGNTGTVPAYDATPNTNPAATPPAGGTDALRTGGSSNNPANPNRPATTNDSRGTGSAGTGTSGRDY